MVRDPFWSSSIGGSVAKLLAAALAGATTVGGNEVIALSDGTQVTFQGFTGLSASSFG